MGILILVVGVGIVLFIARKPLIERASPMPTDLGVTEEGQLKACPNSPNCVSTQSDENDKLHYIAPLTFDASVDAVQAALLDIVQAMPRSTLITNEANYLHFELRSALMGYVDDLEIYIDADNSVVHMRSAARLGQGDLGANRNYLKSVQEKFNQHDFSE